MHARAWSGMLGIQRSHAQMAKKTETVKLWLQLGSCVFGHQPCHVGSSCVTVNELGRSCHDRVSSGHHAIVHELHI